MPAQAQFDDRVLQAVARGWCHVSTSHLLMDDTLAEAIAQEVTTLIAQEQRYRPDHELLPVIVSDTMKPPPHRYYMVGKMVRQDLDGSEPGYRETLRCPCHKHALDPTHVKVLGPHLTHPRYSAHCAIDGELIGEANTMEELWLAVERKDA
jgi:hypothetical protein